MKCRKCHKPTADEDSKCRHCGTPNPALKGMYQSSTVLISAGGADLVYRSVEEVPASLRTRLLESTNGANSATILIADQRGRREITKAMRALPGKAQRRLLDSLLPAGGRVVPWLTPPRKGIILGLVASMALAAGALVCVHYWR